ncbi:TetR/AcrR family transcriptional regulator [Mycolicibacterium brumae]|uniref:TetR/AcrR family transcriptional regulator n=1 Tax=Mycolicibacterium brumae TaxID=85968 RepID=A0A2G5PCX2_9MYCO|nr:TetR/AcrR family transcriptional regulator [Mycolicibacterium brumae]MCV7193598.1 TetR family transcriptional regulator [Mycolicibacterium brumae]PIB76167.1 TetR/AcrR family transcriptional regulator [Mycolicibacterium brumae]RWA17297.1 hypothetical protein MBRU_06645 [Mycolicibacterium brumae DSM 44177]UWW09129.1 TetR family transcriptional regulator [Mycolicibacterium brumae]
MGEPPVTSRKPRDPAKVRANLLAVATEVFAELGYYGARVDDIAARSTTTKRMIYYYFGDKDGLFTAVLEHAYAQVRAAEASLQLADLPPAEALQSLVRHTFRWHAAHPELARLVSVENTLQADHLRGSPDHHRANRPIIATIGDILEHGRAEGVFLRAASALDLHLQMTAMALFQVTNAATVEATFGVDLLDPATVDAAADNLAAMMTAWLRSPAPI